MAVGVCGHGVPDAEALRQQRYCQLGAGAAVAAGWTRDRHGRLRRGSPDQGRPERRRVDVLCRQLWAADEEVVALLARIAENVSFALDNFERADEKAKADVQKERLTRMFAALSATNEAIIRAKSRTELFELACAKPRPPADAFTLDQLSVWCDQASDFLDIVAVRGADRGKSRRQVQGCRSTEHRPEGRGLCGKAFRSRKPCISNDYLNDPRANVGVSDVNSQTKARRAVAAFPLFSRGTSPSAFCCSSPPTRTRSLPEFGRACCSVSPTMCPSRSEISIGPTRRRSPTSRRSGCRGCSRR